MKTISPEFKEHLALGATTTATCWRIERQDKRVFTYTEHDKDIIFNGETYSAMGGFNKTALKSSGSFSVDNMEVTGYLTDDTIPESELRNGAFDYAEVEVFLVNYMDLSMGSVKLRYGFFGEVSTVPSGAFLVELRGLIDMLTTKIGNVYLPECRLDVGDKKCKIKLIPDPRRNTRTYAVGDRIIVGTAAPEGFVPEFALDNFSDEDADLFVTGIVDQVQANLYMEPVDGDHYLEFETNGSSRFFDLLTETSLTAEMIDSGLYSIDASFYVTGREHGNGGKVTLWGCSASNTTVLTSDSYGATLFPTRNWQKHDLHLTLKPGTRRLRWTVEVGLVDDFSITRLAVDGLEVRVKQAPIDGSDFRIYGGVEYECITAGETAAAAPTFTTVEGAQVIDGTVTWETKTPKWMFLDTIAVDATNSSIVTLTDMNNDVDDFFTWGVIKFLSGKNVGYSVEILSYNNITKKIKTALPIPYQTEAGDMVQIQVGCDKRRKTCIMKFNNILEFRGHPDVPGQGQYFKVAGL